MIIKQAFFAVCLCIFSTVQASDGTLLAKTKAKTGLPLEKDGAAQLLIADQLAALGEGTNDPLTFLMAAKIHKSLQIRSADGKQERDETRFFYFLQRAKEIANGDVTYQGLIEELEAPPVRMRGPVSSNILQQRNALTPGAVKKYALSFKGGEEARVVLLLDLAETGSVRSGAIDLDMYVLDDAGRMVCALEGPGVPEYCDWTPASTGKFEIQIKNVGSVKAHYVLNFR